MPKVEIDDEVFAYLQAHARPLVDSVNDVLRRVLLNEPDSGSDRRVARRPAVAAGRKRKAGALTSLIEKGLVKPDHALTFTQPLNGRTHRATVTDDGWIRLEGPGGADYETPSGALRDRIGHEVNGWTSWIHFASKRTLADLRKQALAP